MAPLFSSPLNSRVIHIRFQGRAFDLALASLGLEATSRNDLVKRVLADELDASLNEMDQCVIDRHGNGNLTLRSADSPN